MPDLNDVVRHVILRVIVDADNLGVDLAKTRAQLKGLEDSEKEANKRRAKSFEDVTKAAQGHTDALKAHQAVSSRTASDAEKSAKATAEAHRQSTDAVKQETKALGEQAIAEAQAERIREKTRQDRLSGESKRAGIEQESFRQAVKNALSLDGLQAKLAAEAEARAKKAANQQREADAALSRRDRTTDSGLNRADTNAAAARIRADQNAENARVVARQRADAAIARQDELTGQKLNQNQLAAEEKFNALQAKNADERDKRARTFADTIKTALQKGADTRAISQANVGTAQAREELAVTRAMAEADKAREVSADRRRKSTTAQLTDAEKLKQLAAQTALIEQRAAEVNDRRIRQDEADARRRKPDVSAASGFRGIGRNVQQLLRTVGDADPDTRISRRRSASTSFDTEYAATGSVRRGIAALIGDFKKSEGEAVGFFTRMRSRITAFRKEVASESTGGGGIGGKILGNLGEIGRASCRERV